MPSISRVDRLAAITKRLLELDARWTDSLRVAENPGFWRLLAVFLAHSADSWFWLLGLALVWGLGPDGWSRTAILMGIGVLLTAGVVTVVKFTVRRRRPAGEWGAIYRLTDPHSFPSGHAARAAMLGVLAIGLGPAGVALLLAAWAPLAALARVAMGLHYLSDIAVGMGLGIMIGWGVLIIF